MNFGTEKRVVGGACGRNALTVPILKLRHWKVTKFSDVHRTSLVSALEVDARVFLVVSGFVPAYKIKIGELY